MARPAAASRERMIEAAETLLRERGLAGAGIHDVVTRSGAPIGSLYHFFPGGKTQLVSEALHRQGERARLLLERALQGQEPLPERVRTFFRAAAAGFDRGGAYKGCAIGSVTLDVGADDDGLRALCRAVFDAWVASIAGELVWPDAAERRAFAEMFVMALEGAFILSRARRSGKPFITAGEWLAAALERRPRR